MNNRLFVGNLAFSTTEESILEAFQAFGPVQEVQLMTDRDTGRSRGFAFVQMADEAGAEAAIEGMNGTDLDGRPLRVNAAEERRDRGGGGGRGGGPGGGGHGRRGGGGGGRGGRNGGGRGGRGRDRDY